MKNFFTYKPLPAISDLAFLIFIGFLSQIPWIGFPWKMPLMALLVILFTWLRCGSIKDMGFTKHSTKSTITWAAIVSFVGIVLIGYGILPLVELIFGEVDYSAYGPLVGNKELAFKLWWTAMISASISEEIVYRGFLFSTLERILGTKIWHKTIIVVIGAFLFAVAHYVQGLSGVISIFLVALLFGITFYASRRNIWALIIAHAIMDSWGVFLLYKGWY